MRDPALAASLAAFVFDEGTPALGFAARLARENRWDRPFSERVLAEYRRFLYLASVSEETVTPSVAVDQAWHLHLCYTRSYWHHLCRETLGRELHHGPTRGGTKERVRYQDAYAHTLALYQREFGHPAPADIWPETAQRFAPEAAPVSIAPRDYYIVPRGRLSKIGLAAGIVPLGALLGMGAMAVSGFPFEAVVFLGLGLLIGGLVLTAASRWSRSRRKDRRKIDRGGGCGAVGGCGTGHSKHHDSSDSSGGDSGCGGGGCGGGD